MRYEQIDPFWALGDPVRRRIVDVLASGEHTAGQLADIANAEFRVSRTAASKHLRVLRDAGLVDVRAEEQWRWYRLLDDGVGVLERAVGDLRAKVDAATGWDADDRRSRDPLRGWTRPPRKGPGRAPHPAARGAQRTRIIDDGPDEWMPTAPYAGPTLSLRAVPGDDVGSDAGGDATAARRGSGSRLGP